MRDANELEVCSAYILYAIVDMEPYSNEKILFLKKVFSSGIRVVGVRDINRHKHITEKNLNSLESQIKNCSFSFSHCFLALWFCLFGSRYSS